MRPPVPEWFWLAVIAGYLPLMVQFLRSGVGRELRRRRRARGKYIDENGREVV